jgi:hypothetical protein
MLASLIDALRRLGDGETVVDPTIVARLFARKWLGLERLRPVGQPEHVLYGTYGPLRRAAVAVGVDGLRHGAGGGR